MNYWKQFAEILSLELNQEFVLTGVDGNRTDLFELAVIEFIDEFTWKICCSTEITDDVLGYLTNDDVLDLLERIKNL